ncbi:MAG: dihydroorotate dehydrogenase electron transfer subunit [Deltaproteobacteria bacterium]|nr:dihydroorotate dehydrogenase electron transfer subunit [Deltaproteobacteria bacterium]
MMKKDMMAKILYNKQILPAYYQLGIRWENLPTIEPGQFVMLRLTKYIDPLLRRPFGVYKILGQGARGKGQGIEILYKVLGKGTRLMTNLKPDDEVDILGPLGNSFSAHSGKTNVIIVAGGIGIVPFYLLAKRFKKVRLLFGGRSKDDLPGLDDFKKLKIDIEVSTDDGSRGKKGLVTEIIAKQLSGNSLIYACGPQGMLKEVARIADKTGIPCYVSLDKAMACGIGACLGCAIKVKGQGPWVKSQENKSAIRNPQSAIYKMVCKDGPIFDAREIVWEEI